MSSKKKTEQKSLTELITDLQESAEKNQYLADLFAKAVHHEFGFSIKEVHELINKQLAYENRKAHEATVNSGKNEKPDTHYSASNSYSNANSSGDEKSSNEKLDAYLASAEIDSDDETF